VTGFRSALVLLPQADDVDPIDGAFDLWLEAAGWDRDRMELRPPADHENFGYRVCAVHSCDRVTWGQANQGMCPGCASAWIKAGRPNLDLFFQQSPNRDRWHHNSALCAVERNGKRCPRPARQNGLCSTHFDALEAAEPDQTLVLATLQPLETLGAL